jgi:glycosyltransferase involved in cell wall biosynthesis
MRVVLIGPAYPYRGGIAHFTTSLARTFQEEHSTWVVNFRRLYPSLLFPGKTQLDESASPIRVHSHRWLDSIAPWTYWTTGRRIRRLQPDLVVFQWWHPFFAPAYRGVCEAMGRALRERTIFLCHNVLPHESSPVDRLLSRLAFAYPRRFLVQSREDRGRLQELKPGARIVVRPHPIYEVFVRNEVDAVEARRRLGVEGRMLLFFGLIRPYKGLSVLLEAFARAAEEIQATLWVVGEFYEPREPYDELVERLGIGRRIRWVDRYVPDEEVELYFRACDGVVLPYRSATQSGIVQVAYAFDRPVIVTRVGGLPDVVEDGRTGLVVPPDDPEALARAMVRFYREGMDRRGPEAVARVKGRFSWESCRDGLIELVREGGKG